MKDLDPEVSRFLRRSMIGRIATVSKGNRPQIMPLWFFVDEGEILMNNSATSPTVRNLQQNGHVQVLFLADKDPTDARCLRITGTATFTTDRSVLRRLQRLAIPKYYDLGGLGCAIRHLRRMPAWFRYLGERGAASGTIRITPVSWEFLVVPA